MIKRELESKLREWSQQYPVVTVTGPRQSGKTTLCRAVFVDKPYVSMENIDNREFANSDARGFLARYSKGAIIDEVQHVPDLLSYIQTYVDERDEAGMFILTGSRQFEMMGNITQSLAGRTAVARLLPFSFSELYEDISKTTVDELIYTGFYPRIYDKNLNPTEALSFYLSTYVERDIRQLLAVTDLAKFQTFMKLCAGRTAQLLNMNAIGNECGISHNTARSWLSVLETSGIIQLMNPWHANIGKRLVKSKKLYFLDTGLACLLLGIHKPRHLIGHPLRGALFENLIVADAYKQIYNAGQRDFPYFYRDNNGCEVDMLFERGAALGLYEIKSSMTISKGFFSNMQKLERYTGRVHKKTLIYAGNEKSNRNDVQILPWKQISGVFDA